MIRKMASGEIAKQLRIVTEKMVAAAGSRKFVRFVVFVYYRLL